MKRILSVFVFLMSFSVAVAFSADEKNYVENLIRSKSNQILSIIKQKDISEKEKKKRIFEIGSPLFDFDTMAKLALGRKHWASLSQTQKKRFTDLFVKRLKMTYLDRATFYGNETVRFKPAIAKGKRKVYVPSIVSSKGENTSVIYKFWKSPKGWKIYDVEVEGVSIIRTYRSQFAQILRKGTIDDLFKKLEELTQQAPKK
ncbi:MAG: hypothetical protein DRG39_01400 [Deltaproteobacteria bacterium]|nr:MAG: hypothetical protein DRG39_01400 [Deltaproteobacteria bacterium]